MENLPKTLAFDLDGTLSQSKSHIENDMIDVFSKLLNYMPMSVVSGASKEQFETQFLKYFTETGINLKNLYIFPQNGAELISYKDGVWKIEYENKLNPEEVEKITTALNQVIKDFNLKEEVDYGNLIENRGDQVTLSTLGQKAPLALKSRWDLDQEKRKSMKTYLDPILIDFEIRIGGMTSIDITKKGINKAYAMDYFLKIVNMNKRDLLYFGDALYSGGNDEIVKINGFTCQNVSNPQETLVALRDILRRYEEANGK